MIIVREIFTAKPGEAGKLAKLFKKTMGKQPRTRVMTDLVGPYNTVIMESEMDSLADFAKVMEDYKKGKPDTNWSEADMKEMEQYKEMYQTGRREIFQITE